MEGMFSYPKAAVERAMQVQEAQARGTSEAASASAVAWHAAYIGGSRHRWLQDERWHDLIAILDDATSEIYYTQLVQEESTVTVMAALWEVIERKGLLYLFSVSRHSTS